MSDHTWVGEIGSSTGTTALFLSNYIAAQTPAASGTASGYVLIYTNSDGGGAIDDDEYTGIAGDTRSVCIVSGQSLYVLPTISAGLIDISLQYLSSASPASLDLSFNVLTVNAGFSTASHTGKMVIAGTVSGPAAVTPGYTVHYDVCGALTRRTWTTAYAAGSSTVTLTGTGRYSLTASLGAYADGASQESTGGNYDITFASHPSRTYVDSTWSR